MALALTCVILSSISSSGAQPTRSCQDTTGSRPLLFGEALEDCIRRGEKLAGVSLEGTEFGRLFARYHKALVVENCTIRGPLEITPSPDPGARFGSRLQVDALCQAANLSTSRCSSRVEDPIIPGLAIRNSRITGGPVSVALSHAFSFAPIVLDRVHLEGTVYVTDTVLLGSFEIVDSVLDDQFRMARTLVAGDLKLTRFKVGRALAFRDTDFLGPVAFVESAFNGVLAEDLVFTKGVSFRNTNLGDVLRVIRVEMRQGLDLRGATLTGLVLESAWKLAGRAELAGFRMTPPGSEAVFRETLKQRGAVLD